MNSSVIYSVFLLFFVMQCRSEIVKTDMCTDVENECTIHEVQIDPCKEALKNKACRFKRGINASIVIDFTPEFDSETLYSQPFWASTTDLPFVGMNTNGCAFTTCPIVKNERTKLIFELPIARKFPAGSYNLKWKIGEKDTTETKCCFKFSIKLT